MKEKAAGHEIVVSKAPQAEATNVVDLMDALRRSVASRRIGDGRLRRMIAQRSDMRR